MVGKQQGASLDPSAHAGGGQIPDGDYDIKVVQTVNFTYGGTVPEGVPAIAVTYDDGGALFTQNYKAGDNEHLVASDDGKTFIHPDPRQSAAIFKGGAASQFLASLV